MIGERQLRAYGRMFITGSWVFVVGGWITIIALESLTTLSHFARVTTVEPIPTFSLHAVLVRTVLGAYLTGIGAISIGTILLVVGFVMLDVHGK
ncbi:MAG: hypothetical protein ABEH65_02280 [Halobacteriales archaeon]